MKSIQFASGNGSIMSICICHYRSGDRDFARPWGGWETTATGFLGDEEGRLAFCDKTLIVNPRCALSIQKHIGRQERWRILSGQAVAHLGHTPQSMREFPLNEGEEILIPVDTWHRIENRTDTVMVFAERQSGIYLDEMDNIRYPTSKDPRVTNHAEIDRIRADIARLGLSWP